MTLPLPLPLSPQCMNGRLIRVLTMTHRIITLFQAKAANHSPLLSLPLDVERFQRFHCLPPYEFPPFLAPALLDGRALALWPFRPTVWMAPFISYLYHVSCFLYLDKGLVPPPPPPVQLPPSLAHSILQSQQIDFEAI